MFAARQLSAGLRRYRALSTSSTEVYDVVVIGGGMVGMSLAAALGTNPLTKHLSLAVLDRAAVQDVLSDSLPEVPSARVSTVTQSSIKFFEGSGAWAQMVPHAREFGSMQVWDTLEHGTLRWEASDVSAERMGAVVENSVIQSACYRVASECDNVTFLWPCHVEGLDLPAYSSYHASVGAKAPPETAGSTDSGLASLRIAPLQQKQASPAQASQSVHKEAPSEESKMIKARLVVAADGARSATRQAAGVRTVNLPYSQRAVVATVATEQHNVAWQRFLTTGPLALLPTRSGYSNIVWSTTPHHAKELEHMAPAEFGAAVNEALTAHPESQILLPSIPLPKIPDITGILGRQNEVRAPPRVDGWRGQAPASFPLSLQHAGRYVRPRLALIGDAAHVVHPLAGQGVNLGFGDSEALVAALGRAAQVGADVGELRILQESYEKPRMAINVGMTAALHSLHSVFAIPSGPFAHSRSAGLALINASPLLRDQFMRVAMGDTKLLPADFVQQLKRASGR